jgi:NAD(P)H-flavin reductase
MTSGNSIFKGIKTIDSALGRDKVEFFPELEKYEQEALLGSTFKIEAAKVVEDWDGRYGTSAFILAKLLLTDGKQVTTLLGGKVVLKQVRKLLQQRALLVVAMLNNHMSDSSGNVYYFLDKPPVLEETPK